MKSTCSYTGCNYPEGECSGACMTAKLKETPRAAPLAPIERALASQAEQRGAVSDVLRFLDDLCHPEQYGFAVSREVRIRARQLANALRAEQDHV